MHRNQKPDSRGDLIASGSHEGGRNGDRLDARALGLVKAAYSIREACELLSIGRSSLYTAVKRGELKPVKVGRKTLLFAIDLAAFLRRLGAAT